MMGRRKSDQGQPFCAFGLQAVVPDDRQIRRIAAVLDLSWVRTGACAALQPFLEVPFFAPAFRGNPRRRRGASMLLRVSFGLAHVPTPVHPR